MDYTARAPAERKSAESNVKKNAETMVNLLAAALPALGAVAAGSASAAGVERSFSASPGGTLVVEAEVASVEVLGGGDDVQVRITRGGDDAAEIGKDFDIAFEQDSDTVRISVELKRKRHLWGFLRRLQTLNVAATVPTGFNARIATSSGKVAVAGLAGALDATTTGAGIRVEDVRGPIQAYTSGGTIRHAGASAAIDARTSGGSITIDEVDGAVEAYTSGGRIRIHRAGGPVSARTSGGAIGIDGAADAVTARTSGGGIEVGFDGQPQDDSRLRTSGGAITAHLAARTALDIDASASGGRIRLEGVRIDGEIAKDAVRGSVNGGGPILAAQTSGGSITLAVRRP